MINPTLGEKITTARKRKGWTMAELARRADLSRSYLHAVEHGNIPNPSFDAIMRIAFELDANPLDWWCVPSGFSWAFHWTVEKNAEFSALILKAVVQER